MSAGDLRFEATLHPKRKDVNIDSISGLGIDRVPDPKGVIRALLDPDDLARLLELGFEVRLQHAHPRRPLDRKLIADDESVRRSVREQLRGLLPDDAKLDV
jgi:hypothetical protein